MEDAADMEGDPKSREREARELADQGSALLNRREWEAAEVTYLKALALAREVGLKDVLAVAYSNLGVLHRSQGRLDSAEDMHRKALELDEELGLREGTASDYSNLGLLYMVRGDLEEAEDMLKRSLQISEDLGRKEDIANQRLQILGTSSIFGLQLGPILAEYEETT